MMRLLLFVVLLTDVAHAKLCVTTTSLSPVCPSTTTTPTTSSVTTTSCVSCATCPSTSSTSSSTSTTTLPPIQGDFFIDNSCAFNGSGTADSCAVSAGAVGAWNALTNLNCARMIPSDSTLTIRSHGGTARTQRYLDRWFKLENALCSGTAGHPLIIQNAVGEDVVMEGTVDIHGNTWTDRGGGMWECTSGTNCGPPTGSDVYLAGWYAKGSISGGTEQLVKLVSQRVGTCAGAALAVNQMANVSGAAGNLCVRLADDSSPTTADYFDVPRQTLWLAAYNAPTAYVTLRRNPGGGSWTIRRFRNHIGSWDAFTNIGWTIDGLTVGWVYDRCLQMTPVTGFGAPDWVVQNSIVEYCGQEGIRPEQITGGTTRIENNEIRGIQVASVFANCGSQCRKSYDNGTPIRLAECHNITVRGNIIHDVGGGGPGRCRGIDLEGGGVGDLIENNYIYNHFSTEDHGDSQQASGALNFSAASFGGNDWSANVVRNNRFENVENCFRFQTNVDTSVQTPSIFENNTCIDPKFSAVEAYGGGFSSASPPFQWTNNIFATFGPNTVKPLIYAPGFQGSAWDASAFTFNDFFCSACAAGTQIFNVNGVTAVATLASVQAVDPNSVYELPALDIVGSPPSLKIINTGGAYGIGTAISPVFPDFEGTVRPQSQGWDIGADEFTGTTGTTSSTTTSTGIVTTTTGGGTSSSTSSSVTTTTSTSTTTTTIPTPVQVLLTGGYGAASTSASSVTGLSGAGGAGGWIPNAAHFIEQVLPTTGIIGSLHAVTATAPGGTASWTITLYKNEVATALTCTITSGATSCTDTNGAHNITFALLDRAAIKATPANTPASGILQVSTLWQPTTADETIWPSSIGTTLAAGNAWSLPLNARSANSTRQAVVPIPGTIKHLAAWTYSNVVAGATRTFTLQKNGSDTTLTCTVPEGASSCTDPDDGHAISVVAGDRIETAITFTGTPIDQPLSSGVVFVPTTTTQFVAGMSYMSATPTTATNVYTPLSGTIIGTQLTTENLLAQQVGQAMTLKNLYVLLNGATGSGATLTVTLRKGAADQALTCAMANTATCNLTTDVSVADDDLLDTAFVHTGSAGSSREAAVSYSGIFTGSFP